MFSKTHLAFDPMPVDRLNLTTRDISKLHPALTVLNHPLATHILTHLRDETTKPTTFRTLSDQISTMLAIEATKDLDMEDKAVRTPLEIFRGEILTRVPLIVVPILRAGTAMIGPFQNLFPDVRIGYIGLERDHKTAVAHNYYQKMPRIEGRRVWVVDPMLATGGSAVHAVDLMKKMDAKGVIFVCVVAAPEGLAEMAQHHPNVPIFAGVIDRDLNDRKYIRPGLGDYGDRYNGTDEY